MATKLTQLLNESETKQVKRAVVVNPMSDGNEHLRKDPEEDEAEHEEITRTKPSLEQYGVTGVRHITVGEHKFKIIRRDPYGFWYVSGKAPKALRENTFTNVAEAEKAITLWANNETGTPVGY